MSHLGVVLHGSVHHHKVRQERPQVRDGPLHDALLTDRQTQDHSKHCRLFEWKKAAMLQCGH